jgi:2-polyprenyl-3-methyl-5-hydroxy-6-metoxy-1,4-benzoquinol methylase
MNPLLLDYSTVTEQPAQWATPEQMAMLETRYGWAAQHAKKKDVLEVACGAGLGLKCLARVARSVEAVDLDENNCRIAERSEVPVRCMDAEELLFQDESFDLVLLFEALYYLPDAERFVRQAYRVLRPGGVLLLSAPNPEWSGFHPSPFSTRYFSGAELMEMLKRSGFIPRLHAGFPVRSRLIRRAATALGLIPRTMGGKALLKRLVCGPVVRIPSQLEPKSPPPVERGPNLSNYRVLYVEARK